MKDVDKIIRLSKFFSQYLKKCRFKGCVFPNKSECSKKVIKAHSIQKNKILTKIADNGKVTTYDPRRSTITINFEEIGINSASTFMGFCNFHDTKIFSDIENKDYNEDLKQNFLYAYRACAKEYVVNFEATCTFQHLASDYRLFPDKIPFLHFTLEGKKVNFTDFQGHLNQLNKALLNQEYGVITTKIFKIPYESLMAVNSCFNLIYDFKGNVIKGISDISKKPANLILNIFPQKNSTFILLSCFTDDYNKFNNVFPQLDSFSTFNIESFFSQLVLVHCENIYLSPQKWNSLSRQKSQQIASFFKDSMRSKLPSNYISLKPPINLFRLLKR